MLKMEWTNVLILKFIKVLHKYPVIWDPKEANHKSRKDVSEAWENLRKELGVDFPIENLKKKRECLMTTYRAVSKKVARSLKSTNGVIYKPSWFAYEPLDRLLSSTSKNPALDLNDHNYDDHEEEVVNNDNSSEDLTEIVEENSYNDDLNIRIIPPINDVQTNRKRDITGPFDVEIRKRLKLAEELLKSISQKSETRIQRSNCQVQCQHEPPDECSLYGELLAAKLRAMDKRTRKILTNQIDNLVFDFELKGLDELS